MVFSPTSNSTLSKTTLAPSRRRSFSFAGSISIITYLTSGGRSGIRTLDTSRYTEVRAQRNKPLCQSSIPFELRWCAREDSNLQPVPPDHHLKVARLPVPPRARTNGHRPRPGGHRETRTLTPFPEPAPEAGASTNSAMRPSERGRVFSSALSRRRNLHRQRAPVRTVRVERTRLAASGLKPDASTSSATPASGRVATTIHRRRSSHRHEKVGTPSGIRTRAARFWRPAGTTNAPGYTVLSGW